MPAITEPYQAPAGHPPVEVDARSLTIEQVVEVARFRRRVVLAPRAVERIRQGRDTVQRVVDRREKVYGVTTGFGALCDKVVTGDQVKRLQRNLIISHASGVGAPFSQEVWCGRCFFCAPIRSQAGIAAHQECREIEKKARATLGIVSGMLEERLK
jgi:histidine ammonia-lyase